MYQKDKVFFKRSSDVRKDKALFYTCKMFDKKYFSD